VEYCAGRIPDVRPNIILLLEGTCKVAMASSNVMKTTVSHRTAVFTLGQGGRRLKSCHSDQHLRAQEISNPIVSPTESHSKLFRHPHGLARGGTRVPRRTLSRDPTSLPTIRYVAPTKQALT
jgi:hypothetical protein